MKFRFFPTGLGMAPVHKLIFSIGIVLHGTCILSENSLRKIEKWILLYLVISQLQVCDSSSVPFFCAIESNPDAHKIFTNLQDKKLS